jgi:hypothetical protein
VKEKSPLKKAILKTRAYFKVFEYIPSLEELHKYLIGKKASLEEVRHHASALPARRSPDLSEARRRAGLARFVPGVLAILLTGDTAAGSPKPDSDLDFLVICKDGCTWVTQYLLTFMYSALGWRKSRFNIAKSGVCLNIFLEESVLAMPGKMRNLYIANEIARVKPLYDKGGIYEKFLAENAWVLDYLPNAFTCHPEGSPPRTTLKVKSANTFKVSRQEKRQLFLHKKDLTEWVLSEYKKNCKEIGVSPGI